MGLAVSHRRRNRPRTQLRSQRQQQQHRQPQRVQRQRLTTIHIIALQIIRPTTETASMVHRHTTIPTATIRLVSSRF